MSVKLSGSGSYIEPSTVTAPATPASGKVRLYATSTIYLKMKNSAGSEIVVSTGSTQSVTASGAATTIDFSSGDIVTLTLNASTTLTLTNPITGLFYFIKAVQDATGSRTITWPGTVKWSGGTAPTLTTTASKTDIITLWWDGTNYFGTSTLNF